MAFRMSSHTRYAYDTYIFSFAPSEELFITSEPLERSFHLQPLSRNLQIDSLKQ